MLLKEYIAHRLIGTPLEPIARSLRDLTQIKQRIQHPELHEIYHESSLIDAALPRIIDKSMNCIDVGAHLGSVLSVIKELSPHGKHIAIEPIPYKYQWLKQKYPDVKVLQVAVSDSVGEVDFYLQPQRSGFSGLRLHSPVDEQVEVLKVKCVKLDDIVPPDQPIGFIKIDVEGGELAALRGSESIIQNFQPSIIFECTNSGLTAYDIKPLDIYEFFDARSYSIFLIKDWLSGNEPLVYEQFLKSMQYPFQAFNFLAIPKGLNRKQ
ncbi:methyltransferase FkbM family protein [Calothrix sp. NIES-4071]|nr:methyltransferase FkbM family protein [Calothrix sp. NIES-4071]BAZ63263.1 methyltransferase FkbM family protein [Calothrix sp. NIES-4105]